MRLVAPCYELETNAPTIVAARPTTAGHGCDVAGFAQGGRFAPERIAGFILADANADTLASPTGGAAGVELWTYRRNKAGTKAWFLIGYLNGGTAIPLVAACGFSFIVDARLVGERLCVAGTPAAHAQTQWFTPIEEQIDAR